MTLLYGAEQSWASLVLYCIVMKSHTVMPKGWQGNLMEKKNEKERKSIYMVPFILCIVSKHSDIDRTVLPANHTLPAFPLYVHQMAPVRHPLCEVADIQLQLSTLLSTQWDDRLSWPGWLTVADGLPR